VPTKQIATSTLWQMASQITMAALSILTVKFVAVGLSQELAGTYNSAYGFLQLFGILADFGLYAVAVREVSRATDKERVLGTLIVLRTVILLLSLGSAIVLVWILPAWQGTPLPLAVTIASLVPFFTLLAGILRTVFQVTYSMHTVFIAEVTQRIFTAAAIGAFIVAGFRESDDVMLCFAFLAIGGAGALILLLLSLYFSQSRIRPRLVFDRGEMLRMLKQAAPFGLAFLCTALYRQLDVTLIALLRPDFELQNAYYGFVLRMADMGYLLPTFLLNSVLPVLSSMESKSNEARALLGKTLLLLLILGSVSALFSALWTRPLVLLLTREAYLSTATTPGSDTALALLALPMFLNGLVTFGFYTLLSGNAWKPLVASLSIGAVLSVALNLVLIPQQGFVGAGITSIITHIVLTVLLLPQALRRMPVALPWNHIGRWLAFTTLLAASLWMYQPFLLGEIATVIGLMSMSVLLVVLFVLCGLHTTVLPRRAE
jgi:O-antigen/teichoic acid export membrane protein